MKKITFLFTLCLGMIASAQSLVGTWKMSPVAGAMGVGPGLGDTSWWSNGLGDVTTRACFFDDEYIFNSDGSFSNVLGAQSWIEGWQGGSDACGAPVAPHNGSNAASWSHNTTNNTVTLTGVGAYLGLAKVYNGGELTSPANAPASITYTITTLSTSEMTLDISIGAGYWRFKLTKQVAASPIEGTWKMSAQAGALGVGPNQGDISWWSNSIADVTTRACFFDDEYIFNANGTFSNVLGTQSWIEGWQGGSDACGTPVAPHNGSNSATYVYNTTNNTITLSGVGAYLGLAKVYNGGELTSPANAPASITYNVTSITSSLMTLDIQINGGWWRFILSKVGTPTCFDGIQNGDETGIDCGGSTCPACVVTPTVAAPTPPARPTADVISVFSDAYTNIAVNEWGPNWGPSSTPITELQIASNPTKNINMTAGKTFAGIVLGSYIDLSTFTHFHVDYWLQDPLLVGQVLSFKLSNHAAQAGETNAVEINPTPSTGTWVSIDVPLSSFTIAGGGSAVISSVKEIVLSAARADNNQPVNLYIDNLYFHKNTFLSNPTFEASFIKMYPNPSNGIVTVDAQNIVDSISIVNMLGQTVMNKEINASTFTLDIANLNAGQYFLQLNSNGVKAVKKLIKN